MLDKSENRIYREKDREYILVPRATLEEWRGWFLGYTNDGKEWNYSHIVRAIDRMNKLLADNPNHQP